MKIRWICYLVRIPPFVLFHTLAVSSKSSLPTCLATYKPWPWPWHPPLITWLGHGALIGTAIANWDSRAHLPCLLGLANWARLERAPFGSARWVRSNGFDSLGLDWRAWPFVLGGRASVGYMPWFGIPMWIAAPQFRQSASLNWQCESWPMRWEDAQALWSTIDPCSLRMPRPWAHGQWPRGKC